MLTPEDWRIIYDAVADKHDHASACPEDFADGATARLQSVLTKISVFDADDTNPIYEY